MADNRLARRLFGLPLHVWLLWAIAAAVLAACPMMLSEPAMWFYLMDPELLALIVIIGVRYTRLELAIMGMRIQADVRARAARLRTRRRPN